MLMPSPAHPNDEQDRHGDKGDKALTEVQKFQATCTVQGRPSGSLYAHGISVSNVDLWRFASVLRVNGCVIFSMDAPICLRSKSGTPHANTMPQRLLQGLQWTVIFFLQEALGRFCENNPYREMPR
jgi:hypothetical protein